MIIKNNTKEKAEEFDKKFEFFSCRLDAGMDNGLYKDWDVTFLLLTKEEKENLIKKTYYRMALYNKIYKPKEWAGYTNNKGEEIKFAIESNKE